MQYIRLDNISSTANEAVIKTDLDGVIYFWDSKAERFFGYKADEVIGKRSPINIYNGQSDTLKRRLEKSTFANIQVKITGKQGITNDCFCKITKIVDDSGSLKGYSASISMIHDIIPTGSRDDPSDSMMHNMDSYNNFSLARKRTFNDIRHLILFSLERGPCTINQVSHNTEINWKTVENHLTYLLGRSYVKEVLKSEYVRIFELSKDGKIHIARLKKAAEEKAGISDDKVQQEEQTKDMITDDTIKDVVIEK